MSLKNRSTSLCAAEQTAEAAALRQYQQQNLPVQQPLTQRRASSSGSDSPETSFRDTGTAKIRHGARRTKSERLQGAKPRIKRRDKNFPIDLASSSVASGSDGVLPVTVSAHQTLIRKAPSAGRLASDSCDLLKGSPRGLGRQGSLRPPLPSSVPVIATPDISPSLVRKATVNSSRQTTAKGIQSRPSERSPTLRFKETVHRRTGSFRGPTSNSGSGSGNIARRSAAYLDIPDYASDSGEDEAAKKANDDSYLLRSFDLTRKGVVNRGDSFRRRRSRSNSLAPTQPQPKQPQASEPTNGVSHTTSTAAADQRNPNHDGVTTFRVAIIGTHGVGKTALVSQFMTSESINAYDRPRNDEDQDESVFVMLNGEESELVFTYFVNVKNEMNRNELPDAYLLMYSVIDKSSFQRIEDELARLQNWDALRGRPVIIVGNKIDLVRSRAVSTQDGKCLACAYKGKFMEISVAINHNVDELLVGILAQIRLRKELQQVVADSGDTEPPSGQDSSNWMRNKSLVRASMKAKQIFTWLFGKDDDQYNNCENFQVI